MKTSLFILFCWLLFPFNLFSQKERNLLTSAFKQDELASRINIAGISDVYGSYTDRTRWEAIDVAARAHLIKAGEEALNYTWPTIPATAYLEFVKSGNRKIMEDVFNANHAALRNLVLAELVEGKQRFIPAMINGVWATCEWSTWSISASVGLQKAGAGLPDIKEPILELGAGIIGNTMAWTYYYFKDVFNEHSPQIAKRIKAEIDRRILEPYYTRTDFWWMALDGKKRMVNNWNIWLNYNALTCLLLVEEDETKRVSGIYKTMQSADQFINYYKDDGGCEEGPAYWSHAGGMLFNYLSMLKQASNGSIDLFHEPLVRNIGAYICKAYIDSTYFLNYADASAKLTADAGLIYLYGNAVGDKQLSSFGAYLAKQQAWDKKLPVSSTIYGSVRNLFNASTILQTTSEQPFLKEAWLPETGIAVARDQSGSSDGFYFSALAGHNDESHNHNDVGSLMLYYDGLPVLIDIGNETYTRQTFGAERYSIWTMRSAFHNVPLINGSEQKHGAEYAAKQVSFKSNTRQAAFETAIEAAYPTDAGVKSWKRTYRLNRQKSFEINDHFQLRFNNGQTALHFMTAAPVVVAKNGLLKLSNGNTSLDMSFNSEMLEPSIEEIAITDPLLKQSWPPVVYRIILKMKADRIAGKSGIIIKKSTN